MKRLQGFCVALVFVSAFAGSLNGLAQAEEQPAPARVIEVTLDPRPVILTAVTIPARATLCGFNSWLASIFMTFSAGMRYGDAAHMMESGCAGSWVVTPEMVDQAGPPPKAQRRAVWELDNLR